MTTTDAPPAQVKIYPRMEQVIRHMLAAPRAAYCVSDLCRALGIASGTATTTLQRMVAAGWLDVEVEPRRPGSVGPLRRMHKFTPGTAPMLRRAID